MITARFQIRSIHRLLPIESSTSLAAQPSYVTVPANAETSTGNVAHVLDGPHLVRGGHPFD